MLSEAKHLVAFAKGLGTCGLPVRVGFGISRPGHLRQLAGLADGAIVGSALVRLIHGHMGRPIDAICERVTGFCRESRGVRTGGSVP